MSAPYQKLFQLVREQYPDIDTDELAKSDAWALVSLDRALSPAGDRRLKDAKIALSDWPSPGVFRSAQLAERILLQMERRMQQPLAQRVLQPAECVDLLQQLHPERRVRNLFTRYLQFKHLHPSAIHLERWTEILQEYEATNSLELREWSQIIIDYLKLRLKARERALFISPWQAAEVLLEHTEILQSFRQADWLQILECNPHSPDPLTLMLIESREAYALEAELFRLIETHCHDSLRFLRIRIEETNPPTIDTLESCNSIADGAALFWASPEKTPSTAEVVEWMPGTQALDLASDDHGSPDPELRSFYLYTHFREQRSPAKHPWLIEKEQLPANEVAGLENEQKPGALWSKFISKFAENPQHWIHSLSVPQDWQQLSDWFYILLELKLVTGPEPAPLVHARVRSDGIPFLSIHDILYVPENKKILWGDSKSILALCDPQSSEALTASLLPAHLESCFEAEGISIPNTAKEMRKIAGILEIFRSEISLLKIVKQNYTAIPQDKVLLSPYQKETLSPTAVEAYLKCPMQFYLNRVLRIQDPLIPDPERVQENLRGQWIHKCLEVLLLQLSANTNAQAIFDVLASTVDEIFSSRISRAYRNILLKQAGHYAAQLERHVLQFEIPLLKLYPHRTLRLEDWVQANFSEQEFRGKVDRIDIISKNSCFVWDYKTNEQKQKMATLIKNNTLQWYLYKSILERTPEKPLVIGGGYLNPLAPEKSRLIVVESTESKGLLNLLSSLDYPFEVLDPKQQQDCALLLQGKVADALRGIRESVFSPQPYKDTQCIHCTVSGICGRPYLMEADA